MFNSKINQKGNPMYNHKETMARCKKMLKDSALPKSTKMVLNPERYYKSCVARGDVALTQSGDWANYWEEWFNRTCMDCMS